jgi:hypothetical protein
MNTDTVYSYLFDMGCWLLNTCGLLIIAAGIIVFRKDLSPKPGSTRGRASRFSQGAD